MDFETLKEIGVYGGGGLAILFTILQIAPIKINPWSWLARTIGRAINHDVLEKVDALDKNMKANKAEDDEQWVLLSRSHILRFGDELRRGVPHSKEHFDQTLLDVSKYEHYCENHPDFPNGKAIGTVTQIKNAYQKCLEKNDFLQ